MANIPAASVYWALPRATSLSPPVTGPRQRPKRPSEEADPTDLPPDEFEEPVEEPPQTPDREFDEPSVDDDEEFPEPAP